MSQSLSLSPFSPHRVAASSRKISATWDAEALLRAACDAYPAATAFYLSRSTGMPARTIEKHLRGEARPNADALIAYLNCPIVGPQLRKKLLE